MKLKVTVDGTVYDVEVDVEEEEPPPPLGVFTVGHGGPHAAAVGPPMPSHVSAPANEEKALRAPISGIVTKVIAEPGAVVEAGAVLIVLEAMKMETEITAPGPGTVAEVAVTVGDTVNGGQVLITWS